MSYCKQKYFDLLCMINLVLSILSFQCKLAFLFITSDCTYLVGPGSAVDTGPGSAATKKQDNVSLACK